MRIRNLPSDILQFGIAFVFIYAAIQIILNYQSFVGYAPEFIFTLIPEKIFMFSFAAFEILLGLWLISGKKLLYSALTAAGVMLLINLFNLDLFIVLFRNIAIFCGALALAVMSYKHTGSISITIDTSPEPDSVSEVDSKVHSNPIPSTHRTQQMSPSTVQVHNNPSKE